MTLREHFEARFPVPAGVAWSDEHQNYGWIKKQAFQRTITYRALWTGWQESRATLVVALPSKQCIELHQYTGMDVRHYCAVAIENAGLKVAP